MFIKSNFESLPNELFIECFQYLNASDIFRSFDQLNSRFHLLIRNCPLYVNFHEFKKLNFNEFCQVISSNPELKQNIISLQLSNDKTYGQIRLFLSLFSLNEFLNLRSLSLIGIQNYCCQQLLHALPSLSNLHRLSCTPTRGVFPDMSPALLQSNIRILTIPSVYLHSTFTDNIMMTVISLTIHRCSAFDLYKLLKYTTVLKYLKIEKLYDNQKNDIVPNNTKNAFHLKQFIVKYANVKFESLKLILQCLPSLEIFSIYSQDNIEMIDANRWQNLIEIYLPVLTVFKFCFGEFSVYSYEEKLIKITQFQSDFWHEKHQWYIDYKIDYFSLIVYTLPYIHNDYTLTTADHGSDNSNQFDNLDEFDSSDRFDNVNELSIWTRMIRSDSSFYFRNVKTLRLTSGVEGEGETDEYELQTYDLQFLDVIVNLSNIQHLIIAEECYMSSSEVLLNILEQLPVVSSLTIRRDQLISYLDNYQLCKWLNEKIKTLNISSGWNQSGIHNQFGNENLFSKTFLNVEHLICDIETLDELLLILSKCSKLSTLNIGNINEEIYTWIQRNASTLNIYINFWFFPKETDDN
ncbi:unnamed protein product [Adineta steineri]|uniref:F-box domain-containing protein n=1 Tax=Adineta steineri TaxID=433720 RepID=A0A813VUC5_9BILA|nr:unnamed protein product [Adineta steineri]CAF4031055.1 unnamed protein product [Adineta steineri]